MLLLLRFLLHVSDHPELSPARGSRSPSVGAERRISPRLATWPNTAKQPHGLSTVTKPDELYADNGDERN